MQCDPVSMEHNEMCSVLTNNNITMINTVLIYCAKNTKLYRVSNVQTKATNMLPQVPLSLLVHYMNMHNRRVMSESCERVATVSCACVHLSDCFPLEGHILLGSILICVLLNWDMVEYAVVNFNFVNKLSKDWIIYDVVNFVFIRSFVLDNKEC